MVMKCFLREGYGRINGGTRLLGLAADNREGALGKGSRSTSTNPLEIERTHAWGWSSTPSSRRTAAARGAAQFGGADSRSAAGGTPMCGGFWLKLLYPAPLRSEPRSSFPTQPLLSSVPTIDRSASGYVPGLSRKHAARMYMRPPSNVSHKGGYGRYCTDQPVPETVGSRRGHDKRDGRSDYVVAMIFYSLPRREGKPMQREEWLLSRTRVCVDRVGAFNDLGEGFSASLPPQAPARPESHMSLGLACPTRPPHAYHLGAMARIVEIAT
jgi:hypothetical protein